MKSSRLFAVLSVVALSASWSSGAESKGTSETATASVNYSNPPEFRGILTLGHDLLFSLSSPGGAHSAWLKVGESFDGWKLQEYKPTGEILVVASGGKSADLHLASSKVGTGEQATAQASAEDIIRKMHLDKMFSEVIQQQRLAMMTLTKQMMAHSGASGASQEKAAEFQGKVMDALWSEMNPAQLKQDMIKIYSDTFSAAELQGLSDFYSTSAGQAMIAKQPEISQKMLGVMMPRMMAAMPKIQQMGREFAAQNPAAAASSATTPAVGTTSTKPSSATSTTVSDPKTP